MTPKFEVRKKISDANYRHSSATKEVTMVKRSWTRKLILPYSIVPVFFDAYDQTFGVS